MGLHHVQNETKYSAAVALFDLSHFLGIEFYLNFNLSPAVSWLSSQQADRYLLCMETHPTSGARNRSCCLHFTSVLDTAADEGLAKGGIPPIRRSFGCCKAPCYLLIHTEFLSHD